MLTAQQTIPAKGHSPVSIPGKEATCTDTGLTDGSKCSVCGTVLTAQQTIHSKAHWWDEGVVTKEPGFFEEGEITYTCKRDAKHKKTETIPAKGSATDVISILNGNGPSEGGVSETGVSIDDFLSGNEDPLRIVEQPQGGTLPDNGILFLTCKAEGGEGAYSYEWFYESPAVKSDSSTIAQVIAKVFELLRNWLNTGDSFEATTKSFGISPDPWLNAGRAGSYWCVVYDEADHTVTSEKAEIPESLYIIIQPQSGNIYGFSSVTLSCRAGGGSGNYSYTWYNADGDMMEDQAVFAATETGEYHCLVWDTVTNDTVESMTATVYSDEATQISLKPIIIREPSGVELGHREDDQYSFEMTCEAIGYDGDDKNLIYSWQKKGTGTGGSWGSGWGNDSTLSLSGSSQEVSGVYRCFVIDLRTGETAYSREARVKSLWCNIDGHEGNGYFCLLNYTIQGGNAPYDVMLYQHRRTINENYMEKYIEVLIDNKRVTQAGSDTSMPVELSYSTPYQSGGVSFISYGHASYYIVVQDASGDIYTTSIYEPIKPE